YKVTGVQTCALPILPVAGQPGQYVTGLLPVLPQQTPDINAPSNLDTPNSRLKQNIKIVLLLMAMLVILLGSGLYILARTGNTHRSEERRVGKECISL